MGDLTWTLVFWSFLIVLFGVEMVVAADQERANRSVRWPLNIALGVTNGAVFALLPLSLVLIAQWAAESRFGLLNQWQVPAAIIVVLTVTAQSLGQYLFHRLAHAVPLLWSFHRVHHCDPHFDASTGLRFHPLELLAMLVFMAPWVALLGLDAATIAGFEIAAILIGIFTHTSLSLPRWLDGGLRVVFITPALHALHHSDLPVEYNSNYGAVFSLWDRLFGTLTNRPTREKDHFRVGVPEIGPEQSGSFRRLISLPFARTGAVSRRRSR